MGGSHRRQGPLVFLLSGGRPSWYDFYSPDRVSTNQPDVCLYRDVRRRLSATISFEDGTGAEVNNGFNGGFNNAYLGDKYPDIVAAARADQTWGSAQLSAVAHNTRVIGVSGDTGDLWGYAVLAGATANLPWLGNGDKVRAARGLQPRGARLFRHSQHRLQSRRPGDEH